MDMLESLQIEVASLAIILLRIQTSKADQAVWMCKLVAVCTFVVRMQQNRAEAHIINIGITHAFSCINICRVPRKLFEHEADRPSIQTSPEGPGKC